VKTFGINTTNIINVDWDEIGWNKFTTNKLVV
jgi:hypothetical protein